MSKVIRISQSIFSRLQKLSIPLIDTPASVIERLLNYYEKLHDKDTSASSVSRTSINKTEVNASQDFEATGLYLAPATKQNLETTIVRSQPIDRAKPFLGQEQYELLEQALKGDKVFRCWAMTKNSRSKFNAMKKGDWVLFTSKGTGRFSYVGRVICKLESAELGRSLWSVVPGLPWELIYFFKDVTPVNIPKETLVSALGFDQGYVVPGIIRVSSERVNSIIGQYGSISELISKLNV